MLVKYLIKWQYWNIGVKCELFVFIGSDYNIVDAKMQFLHETFNIWLIKMGNCNELPSPAIVNLPNMDTTISWILFFYN